MVKLLKVTASAVLAMVAATTGSYAGNAIPARLAEAQNNPLRFAPKSRYERLHGETPSSKMLGRRMEAVKKQLSSRVVESDVQTPFPASFDFGYMDAPDGTTWFYTGDLEIESELLPGGMATKDVIKGFTFTVYDNNYNVIGSISDQIELADGETGIADVELGATLTKKFFNTDEKYEVMVMIVANTAAYSNNVYTKVYSLGGDEPLMEIDGYYVDAINTSSSSWSEDFYITFQSDVTLPVEDSDDNEMASYARYTTYKKAGWSGPVSVLGSVDINVENLAGNNGAPFMSSVCNGSPYFVSVCYEKPFFLFGDLIIDPDTGEPKFDMTPTPDNNFVVTLYNSKFETVKETVIPMETKTELQDVGASFYEIGMFKYTDDVTFGKWSTGNTPAYIITVEDYIMSTDESSYSFYVFDTDGNKLKTICENADGTIELSNIKGTEEETAFLTYDSNGDMFFTFVGLPSCEVKAEIPVTQDGNRLTALMDRYPNGDSYNYVISMSGAMQDGDDAIHPIAWFGADGTLDHIEYVNLGPSNSVAIATPYISQETLSPYMFNTDNEREYALIVQKYIGTTSSETEAHLFVGNTNNQMVTEIGNSDEFGVIVQVSFVNLDSNPALLVIYYSDQTDNYKAVFYPLPLSKFAAGGDGSVENPYIISTIGDLEQIKSDLTAHYRLGNDIDARNFSYVPVEGVFSGSLDGANHTIIGLDINSGSDNAGLFARLGAGSSVKNLNLADVTINVGGRGSVGCVAGSASGESATTGPVIENVHIDGLMVTASDDADATFGSVVGEASLYSKIRLCSVRNASVDLPYDGFFTGEVGGIAGKLQTGASVSACSFSGDLTGGVAVGGIVGATNSVDESVVDCHVSANLTAQNTLGGIVGDSGRSSIKRCYVEGTLTATNNDNWGAGAMTGGVVGKLASAYTYNPDNAVVQYNVVALSSITVPEITDDPEYANQSTTTHRIIGWTIYNEEVYGDYVYNEDTGEYEEVPGEPNGPDQEITDNYAVEGLSIVDAEIVDEVYTTEGKTVAKSDLGEEFFKGLTFAYGTEASAPWSEGSGAEPYLFFENVVRALVIDPEYLYLAAGESAIVTVTVVGGDACDVELSVSDEMAASLSDRTDNGNTLTFTVTCNANNSGAVITASVADVVAECHLMEVSGVEDAVADSVTEIAYNGYSVSASGCTLTVYNVAGMQVAAGHDSVRTDNLSAGVYVVVAVDADGSRTTAKIVVK